MGSEELLQAMLQMAQAQNWHACLHFRRAYISSGGRLGAIGKSLRTLSHDEQLAYGRYFSNPHELSNPVRAILHKELASERQAKLEAYSQRLQVSPEQLSHAFKSEKSIQTNPINNDAPLRM